MTHFRAGGCDAGEEEEEEEEEEERGKCKGLKVSQRGGEWCDQILKAQHLVEYYVAR